MFTYYLLSEDNSQVKTIAPTLKFLTRAKILYNFERFLI